MRLKPDINVFDAYYYSSSVLAWCDQDPTNRVCSSLWQRSYVGHGALILVWHSHLLSMEWRGPAKFVRAHWEFGVYKKN